MKPLTGNDAIDGLNVCRILPVFNERRLELEPLRSNHISKHNGGGQSRLVGVDAEGE
jgi:hypothetical protein